MHVWWGFQICTCECWPKFVTCTAISYMQLHSTSFYFYYTLSLSLLYIYIKICITFERLKSTRHEACFFVLTWHPNPNEFLSVCDRARSVPSPGLNFTQCDICPMGFGTLPAQTGLLECPACPAGRYQNGDSDRGRSMVDLQVVRSELWSLSFFQSDQHPVEFSIII